MIDTKTIVSFAQYREDLVLDALLSDVNKGFYVDVGANYADKDSVTKLFYLKGWRGINIEPIKSLADMLEAARPEDINLNYGVGAEPSKAKFREYLDTPGHSTFESGQKKLEASTSYKDYDVQIKTLSDIFAQYKVKAINFLKIDVEGYEHAVIAGNDWTKYRPEVICIEANHVSEDWQKILTGNKYFLFISDGLNDYYVAEEHKALTNNFADKIVTLAHYSLKEYQNRAWSEDLSKLDKLSMAHTKLQQEMQAAQLQINKLEELATLSLKNIPLNRRIKRAIYGLSVDWVKYKRS